MVKKDIRGIDPGKIILSAVLGFAFYILLLIFFTVLVKNELLPYKVMKIVSKLSLFVACLLACSYAKSKGRGEPFINCAITSFVIFIVAMLAAMVNEDTEFDYAGMVICLLLCILGCFLLFVKKRKNSKLHKRRIRR